MRKDPNVRWTRVDASSLDLTRWSAAVIGGTGGLGRAIAHRLASCGAQVTVVGRTFRDTGTPNLTFVQADLSLMRDADRVAKALPAERYDLLLFTTGIIAAPTREQTAEGLERDMAVSFLNRLVMLREFAPRLGRERPADRASHRPRVFVMGYPGAGQAGTLGDLNAERSYGAVAVHMNTVAGNESLVLDGATRYPHLDLFGLNPGLVRTEIRDNLLGKGSIKSMVVETLIGWFAPSPEGYATRITPLLVSADITGRSGAMFDRNGAAILPTPALTQGARALQFLTESDALVARVI